MTDNNQGIVITRGEGLVAYRLPYRESSTESQYLAFHTFPDGVQVRALAFDRFGQLWGCGLGGVIRWTITPSQTTFRTWHSEHGLAGADLSCLLITNDSRDRIVFGHESGYVSVLVEGAEWLPPIDTQTGFGVRALTVGDEGHILACTDVAVVDIDTGEIFAEVPELPHSMAYAFGKLWLGTDSALWYWQGGSWREYLADLHHIRQLYTNERALWIAAHKGVHVVNSELELMTAHPVLADCHIAPVGNLAHIASGTDLYWYDGAAAQKFASGLPERVTLLASNDGALVFNAGQQLIYSMPKAENRELLPSNESKVTSVARIITSPDEVWLQDYKGMLWRQNGDFWVEVTRVRGWLTGLARLNDHLFASFEAVHGLAQIIDGRLKPDDRISYVIGIAAYDNALWAATSNILYRSADGHEWTQVAELESGIVAALIANEGSLRLVATDAIYQVRDNQLVKVADTPTNVRLVAFDGDDLVVSNGRDTIAHIDSGYRVQFINLPISSKTITCIQIIADQLWAGTPDGLWVDEMLYTPTNSGLPSASILDIAYDGTQAWVITAQGTTRIDIGALG